MNELQTVRYPDIQVQLTGVDGNAFRVLASVSNALRRGLKTQGWGTDAAVESEIRLFQEGATSGDYDHLLQTCMSWAEVS